MKGIVLMQNSFEDTEALATIDVLKRAGLDITLVNMSEEEIITSQYQNKIIVPTFYNQITLEAYDFLVIPGGMGVSKYLVNDNRVYEAIDSFHNRGKLVACICAAPVLLKKYLENKKFTCYPSYAHDILGKYSGKATEVNGNFIMAKSMYYSIDFALEIVNYLLGKNELVKKLKAE